MPLTLVSLSGFQGGIEAEETGINIQSFSIRYFPEFKRKVANRLGQTRGFVIPSIPSAELSLSGHVTGATGVMAATFATAFVPGNDVDGFGRSAGAFYLDEATEAQTAEGLRMIDVKFTADPLITS